MPSQRNRLARLVRKLMRKLAKDPMFYRDIIDELSKMLRFAKDILSGRYKVDAATIAIVVGALAYVLSPLDAVPDVIPVVGLLDDATVLTIAFRQLSGKIADWEAQRESS